LQVLRGTLSRWILPYDHNTRIDEQSSTLPSVLETIPEFIQGKISDEKIHYLVTEINHVRRLVRVKIADDNDLEQAKTALKTIVKFFVELNQLSLIHTEFSMFQLLEWQLFTHPLSPMNQGHHK
jgi:hypothetical protein